MGFAAGVLSRIPVEWQGFALDWEKREVLQIATARASTPARSTSSSCR